MKKMTRLALDKKAIILRGENWYYSKLAEECSELSAILLQFLNKDSRIELLIEIEKEIADVLIGINYYKLIHKDTSCDDNIKKYKKEKYIRIDRKVKELLKETKMGVRE